MRQLIGRVKSNLAGGVVGLANVGKSTFFQAITNTTLGVPANYPFATIDPETAKVQIPSPRLEKLAELYKPDTVVPATLSVVDIAGLVRGAASGQGLGNAFLSHIRAVDGLFQMVRCFDDADITHVENSVDPIRDAGIIHDELVLKDMEFVQTAVDQAKKGMNNPKGLQERKELLDTAQRAAEILDSGKRVDTKQDWTDKQIDHLRQLSLLTTKPSVFVANISEEDWCFGGYESVVEELENWTKAHSPGDLVLPVSVNFESRMSQADPEDALAEMQELGVQSGLPAAIHALRSALGLQSYFTAGPKEVHEWTIRVGTKAPGAAGAIHTDLEKTFINASVIKFDDMVKYNGDEGAVKKAGKIHREGKDYVVDDGDIIQFNAGAAKK